MYKWYRNLSTTARRFNRGPLIDSVVLDQLRDIPKSKSQDILILNPKSFQKQTNVNNSKPVNNEIITTHLPNLFAEEDQGDDSSIIKSINNLRILQNHVTDQKYASIQHQIKSGFTNNQLREYIRSYYDDPSFKGNRRGIRGANKSILCNIIIKDLWNIRKSGLKTSVEDYFKTSEIKLDKKHLFLLLSKEGLLLNYLGRIGCQITFDPANDTIKFVGTDSQLISANVLLNTMMKNSYNEVVNMKLVKKLYKDKYGDFNLNRLSQLVQVHFQKSSEDIASGKDAVNDTASWDDTAPGDETSPGDDSYILTSLTQNQNKRAKRLLLWLLDSNPHIQNHFSVPGVYENYEVVPVLDTDSMPWNERLLNLFRLSQTSLGSSDYIRQQFKDFEVVDENANMEELDELKSLLNAPETIKVTEDIDDTAQEPILTEEELNAMYQTLSQTKSNFIDASKVSPPIFTTTFGNILFEGNSTTESTLPILNQSDLKANPKFSTNIPLINDKVFNLPLFDTPNLTLKDLHQYRVNDPYRYCVQLKFLPALYSTTDVKALGYPPVEIWMDLNTFGKPEMDSLSVLTVENENNWLVSLPNKVSDLKVSSQVTGDVFMNEMNHESDTNISQMLESSSSKYAKYRSQPGLETFLENSQLDFSGRHKVHIDPTLTLIINGKEVVYQYISVNYRKQLEFLHREKLVQFSIIDGGALGGKKTEITVVGNSFDQEGFRDLVRDSLGLLNR